MKEEILEFYKSTSTYTDMGLYKNIVEKLPNNIEKLCVLQRKQIIHPINLLNEEIRSNKKSFYGDMTRVSNTRLIKEDDIYPTALSMFAELLRRDSIYSEDRDILDKIHVTCRGQALLLCAILKCKGIPARVRSGFIKKEDNIYYDHWISEYYDFSNNRWVFCDADMCCNILDYNPFDIPKSKFLCSAEAWLGFRNNKIQKSEIYNAGYSFEKREDFCIEVLLYELFYDFHSIMNNEIIYLHTPKYLLNKHFNITEEEAKEIDNLAILLLDIDKNFDKIKDIWENEEKFRILGGALN